MRVRLAELTGKVAVTAAGERLGRVYDVHVERSAGGGHRVSALLVGRLGLVARLGLTKRRPAPEGREAIAWEDVLELREHEVVVRSR